MTPHDLEVKFFTEHLGWKKLGNTPGWVQPLSSFEDVVHMELPNIARDWQAFHDWVVPELVKSLKGSGREYRDNFDRVAEMIGTFVLQNETPKEALEWAMEELGNGI